MKKYNAIVVFDKEVHRVLMCRRSNEPYKGKFNFVGGKIDSDETSIHAAYRELYEETGIKSDDIKLIHVMDLDFHITDCGVELYMGKLNKQMDLKEEKNPLFWVELSRDFSDLNYFAGEGDIAYILQYISILGLCDILEEK